MPSAPKILSPSNGDGTLVVIASVAATFDTDGVTIDDKLYSGLILYLQEWGGPVVVLTPVSVVTQAYSTRRPRHALPFRVVPFDLSDPAVQKILADATIILASADDYKQLTIWRSTARPVVYIIEYTLRTRLQQIRATRAGVARKLKTLIWTLSQERPLRDALRNGAGMQCNGTPAFAAYGWLNGRSLRYFDTRMTDALMIDDNALAAKARRVGEPKTLRLVYSGRLETIKGAHHLVTIARLLKDRAIDFTLEIFGTGSLLGEMQQEIADAQLEDRVKLHGAVDFASVLVPHFCDKSDLFLCCHLQDDPSCTYLETLSCGVPIAGYRNRAFEGVLELGDGGAISQTRTPADMARLIGELNADRHRLTRLMRTAANIGRAHSFEKVFAERIEQLRTVSNAATA